MGSDSTITFASDRPDGIVAAVLAIVIATGGGFGLHVYARHVAERGLGRATARNLPLRYQTLALQRAALASGRVLPIYGSSELFCCGDPLRPTQLFSTAATGFRALALGRPGTANLFFMQTFAVLGGALRDRNVVLSESPSWFYTARGVAKSAYASTFLPELVYPFLFDAPISRRIRQVAARRMLAFPDTLSDEPLLRLALEAVADPTPRHAAEYAGLAPLGHLASWAAKIRDDARTVVFGWQLRRLGPPPRPRQTPGDWTTLATRATDIAQRRDTTNPFGFPDDVYGTLRREPRFPELVARYRSGATNRDGTLLPPPTGWQAAMEGSMEWTDLRLALRALHEVGARPLVWSLPLPGPFEDYTRHSAAARRAYYDRYERAVAPAKVAWLDFRAHDEDTYFLNDPGSHLSSRGWAFADRALDLFWHGRSIDDIRAELAGLARAVPPPVPPQTIAHAAAIEGGVAR